MSEFKKYISMIFWDFKRADNVEYNFEIMEILINDAKESDKKNYYVKPLILIMTSILECLLYDLLKRGNEARNEPINLTEDQKSSLEDITVPSKFGNFIDLSQSNKLLGPDNDIYKKLRDFLDCRNRIHIQNIDQEKPLHEQELWTVDSLKDCGNLIMEIFKYCCENFPRPEGFHGNPSLNDFPQPWNLL